MKLLYFVVVTSFAISPVWAKKVALVVGGATTSGEKSKDSDKPRNHEFGRSTARTSEGLKAKGFEVTTLFDNVGIKVDPPNEDDKMFKMGSGFIREEMAKDYNKLSSLNATAATEASVLSALRKTMSTLKAGDEFEFTLNAHGLRFCNGSNTPEKSTLDNNQNNAANCKHMIVLNDPATGKPTYVETKKIADVVREMDNKGIQTNLTFTSCHSGQAQDLFNGLKNTCVLLAASGNNWGMSCMPDDSPTDPGYMAALDAVNTNFWKDIAPTLLQDEYFKEDPCTEKLLKQYNSGISGDNRYDLFMSARAKDGSPTEPSISSQFNNDYFRTGRFSALLINGLLGESNLLCDQQNLDVILEDLLKFGENLVTNVDREAFSRLHETLKASMDSYDQNIRKQKEIINQMESGKAILKRVSPQFDKDMKPLPQSAEDKALFNTERDRLTNLEKELRKLQDAALADSPNIIKHERTLVEFANQKFLKPKLSPDDPCLRKSAKI